MSHKNDKHRESSRAPSGGRGRFHVEKAKDFKGTLKKLYVYLKPYRLQIFFAALMSIVAAILTVLGPWMLGLMTSEIIDAYDKTRPIGKIAVAFAINLSILELAGVLIVVYLLSFVFGYLQSFLLIGMTQNLTYGMRKDLSFKINRLPLKFFDSRPFGEVLSRITNDVETISMTLNQSLSEIFRAITLFIGIVTIMFILSPILAATVLTTTVLSFIAARKFVKRSQGYFRKQAKSQGQLNGHIEEIYSGHTVVKVFNHQGNAYKKFDGINNDLYESSVKSQFISGIMFPVQMFFGNIAYIAVTVIGVFLVMSNNPLIAIQVGIIQTFIQYTRQINQPIQSISSIANVLQSTAAASERVFEFLDAKEEPIESDDLTVLTNPKGYVTFHDVHFGYNEGEPVIKGLNAEIKPGQKIAIVGPTGAGKTTLVNLLMRFYELDSGTIKIDGINIKDMKRSDVRNLFGMVLQDTWLFEGSILENIQYGSNKSFEDVIKASKLSQVSHFIEALSGGYNFQLAEDGLNISQGQRQLLTITRAMLADKPMLILDEATSSVDTRTEVLIQNAMEILMKDRTSFVIAHRLSTIKDADIIFVMKDGNIIEQGDHNTLINQKGFYEQLYNSQFEDA